jgi:hypothetical protein
MARPARQKRTVYVLRLSDGRTATATKVGDKPPVVRMRYRGVGSGRQLRTSRRTDVERESKGR